MPFEYHLTGKPLDPGFKSKLVATRPEPTFPKCLPESCVFLGSVDDPILSMPGKTEPADVYLDTAGKGALVMRVGPEDSAIASLALPAAHLLGGDATPHGLTLVLHMAQEAGLVATHVVFSPPYRERF